MPLSSQSRVFLSYAHKDGTDLVQFLHGDLTKNFDTWLDTKRLTAGEVWSAEIEHAIDRADVLVALLSEGSFTSDICRAEQIWALDEGKCVIPILVERNCRIPIHLKTRQYLDFSNQTFYSEQLSNLIASIHKKQGVSISPELLGRYNNTPALPQNFVPRPEILEHFRNTLFAEAENRNIAVTAMQGMGGIGKTVLAQALCHDEAVRRAYPDGIFWFSIGKERQVDFAIRVKEVPGLHRLLGQCDGDAAFVSEYLDVMRKKAALVVLDDVWRASDVQPFLAGSPRSRLLITTRDTSIGPSYGAREFTASLLTEAESRQVLAKWCGRAVAELPPQTTDLIHECGYLPLALAMIGAQLRGKPPVLWNSVLENLRRADLQKITAQFPEPHTTLFRAIQISVEALDKTACQRYFAMAVLLEDMVVVPKVQQCIWGVDENEAAETAELYVRLSLAQRDQPEGSVRLHDLQLDYVRAQYPDKDALQLIHSALRLSSHVIARDPSQFTSQMVGRLLLYQDRPAIGEFTMRLVEGTRADWIRSMHPTLYPPGTALIRVLQCQAFLVSAVAVTPDGQRAVSGSSDQTLKVWDLGSGRLQRTLTGHTRSVTAVALTRDGQRAVSACGPSPLKVWDLASGRELQTLTGHDWVLAVAVTPDGQRAVSASEDHTLKVWDLASGRELQTLTGHTDWVLAVAVTPDGQRAVSGSRDNTMKVWDLKNGCQLRTLRGHTAAVSAVAVTSDGQHVVSASDHTLRVWDSGCGHDLPAVGHSNSVTDVVIAPDGQRAVSASRDKTLKVWDLKSGRELQTLAGHTDWVLAVAVTPDGQQAVSGSRDNTMKVWDLKNGCQLRTLRGHTTSVSRVAVTPDGQRALSASSHTLKVWNLKSGRELTAWDLGSGSNLPIPRGADWIRVVLVTPDGQQVVSAFGVDPTLRVRDLQSGRELHTLTGHSSYVNDVAMSGDGRLAVSASEDDTLKVWDLASGRELRTLTGHTRSVSAVAVTPDGQRAVSGSHDNTVKVWDLETGEALATFTCDSAALCCSYSDVLKLIVVGDAGGHVHLLRLEGRSARTHRR